MGAQGAVGATSSPLAANSNANGLGSMGGHGLTNGIGSGSLASKGMAALKNGNGATANLNENAAALAAKAEGGAAAQDGALSASAAQSLAAGASDADGLTALNSTADGASAALSAAQSSQAAQAALSAQTASASGAAATTSAAAAAASLAPTVGTPDWEDALSQKVVFLSSAHQQSAELTLNPPDLGPLQVVLQVAGSQAHALFVSQHQQVREAVEAALPKLREALESGGLGLGSASVSDGAARQSQQQGQEGGGRSGSRQTAGDDAVGGTTATATAIPQRRTVGLVDTFA
jgi:flagellar hook-length control protein FliK